MFIHDVPLEAGEFEQITVNTSIGLTSTKLSPVTGTYADMGARFARIQVETDQIRYRLDGGVPTSTVGVLLDPGTILDVEGSKNLSRFRAIKVTNNAQLNVEYYFTPAS